MKWNKLTTRKMTEDEVEIYGDKYDFMWDGTLPEPDEEVLVLSFCLQGSLLIHISIRG